MERELAPRSGIMSIMADDTDVAAETEDRRTGRAIVRGLAIGFPVCLVGLTLAIWFITNLSFADAFATALLPGILLGGFAGGFAGIAATMD